jgi:dipeptidyl aminopeptidase/acylaminoacyl peptidase
LQGEKEGAVRLLADAGGVDRAPAWSPDGRKIAFVSSFVDGAGGTEERIYAVRPDGHELSLLWPDLGGESPVYGITLSWSPDGSSLICGDEIVYELTVDGFTASAPKRIVAGYTPDLSLDGTRLAFAVTRSDGLPNDLDLQVMALDGEGGDWVNLTRRIERAGGALNESHDPEWSPDGTQIAFVDGEEMIYVVNVEAALRGGNEATIAWVTRGRDPAWSPDGRRLAFAYRRGGNWDLYVAAAEPADARSALTQRGLAAMVIVALLILVSGRGAAFTLLVALSAALVGAVMGSPDGLTGASHMATTGAFWGAWTGFTVGTIFWLGVWALYTSWTRRVKSAGIPRP